MKARGLGRALEALASIDRNLPYALHPADRKRRLIDELAGMTAPLKIAPLVIGGLAVSHHGYPRTTEDVGLLLSREDGDALFRRLKKSLGWRRAGEGFRNTTLDVRLDLCIEGQRTSPRWEERFPSPRAVRRSAAEPLPVVSLPDLLALKAMSGRAKDDADVIELLKVHRKRLAALVREAKARLKTTGAGRHLSALAARAREELARFRERDR
jgi:hypothetical protein